jgi:hypothetical protein
MFFNMKNRSIPLFNTFSKYNPFTKYKLGSEQSVSPEKNSQISSTGDDNKHTKVGIDSPPS